MIDSEEDLAEDVRKKAVVVEVDGEDHTLGNVVRDIMWSHPSISVAQYSQENDASDKAIQVNLHCQSVGIPAEQAMVESLTIAKHIFKTVGDVMEEAVDSFVKAQDESMVDSENNTNN